MILKNGSKGKEVIKVINGKASEKLITNHEIFEHLLKKNYP